MNRNTIILVWVAGIVLMLAVYAIGPQHFLTACADFIAGLWARLGDLIDLLTLRTFDAVRAAAIGLYAVFVVLSVLAWHRSLRTGGTLIVVSILFLLLIGTHWYGSGTRWLVALVLAGAGAASMTRRLMHPPPPPRDPRDRWGAAGYRNSNPPGAGPAA